MRRKCSISEQRPPSSARCVIPILSCLSVPVWGHPICALLLNTWPRVAWEKCCEINLYVFFGYCYDWCMFVLDFAGYDSKIEDWSQHCPCLDLPSLAQAHHHPPRSQALQYFSPPPLHQKKQNPKLANQCYLQMYWLMRTGMSSWVTLVSRELNKKMLLWLVAALPATPVCASFIPPPPPTVLPSGSEYTNESLSSQL